MNTQRLITAIVLLLGGIGTLLGGLWALQGFGFVRVEPLLCVANCEPIQGPSLGWGMLGCALAAAGIGAIWYSLKRPARRRG
jgi:hypothetical protein